MPSNHEITENRDDISLIEATTQETAAAVASAMMRDRRKAQKDAQWETVYRDDYSKNKRQEFFQRFGESLAKNAAAAVNVVLSSGGVLAIVACFCVLLFVGAIISTPLGILFSNEATSPGAIPLNTAIAQINADFSAQLETLLAQEHTSVEYHGQTPPWRDVVAVFACKAAEDAVVVELTVDRVSDLRAVFWDMTSLSYEIEATKLPKEDTAESDPEESVGEIEEEIILHINITAKTASEMEAVYCFTDDQCEMLEILLAELDSVNALFGDLRIQQEDAKELLNNLPGDLSPERRKVVENALKLVGKVNYFWGGKSLTLGWDNRWGTLSQVWATGSKTTGTWRPFGLDCSGFVDWVFFNCSSSNNNVVITGADGFSSVAVPQFCYGE